MRRIALWIIFSLLLIGLAVGAPIGRLVAQEAGTIPASAEVGKRPKVDLNRADRSEIGRLPGMTPQTVDRIIKNRPYRKLDELISRKVIGKKQFAEIREYIAVGSGGM